MCGPTMHNHAPQACVHAHSLAPPCTHAGPAGTQAARRCPHGCSSGIHTRAARGVGLCGLGRGYCCPKIITMQYVQQRVLHHSSLPKGKPLGQWPKDLLLGSLAFPNAPSRRRTCRAASNSWPRSCARLWASMSTHSRWLCVCCTGAGGGERGGGQEGAVQQDGSTWREASPLCVGAHV